MSLPKDGGDVGGPAALTPGGGGSARPREGSRDIQKEGKIVSVPDDWCHSPIKIVPYAIWAWQSDASNLADTVRQTDDRSHAKHSIVQMCFGDEAGIGGGVISHTHNGACWPKTWSETVRFQGRNAVRHDDEWWMNNRNTWGKLQYSENVEAYRVPEIPLVRPSISPAISTKELDSVSANSNNRYASLSSFLFPPLNKGEDQRIKERDNKDPLYHDRPDTDDTIPGNSFLSSPLNRGEDIRKQQNNLRVSAMKNCRSLAKGTPGAKYKGGSNGYMTKPTDDGLDSHHIPSNAASPLPTDMGPAIQMEEVDHDQAASQSVMPNYQAHIDQERDLIAKGDFLGATKIGTDDIKNKFPGKYDDAINQMLAYTRCLKNEGVIR